MVNQYLHKYDDNIRIHKELADWGLRCEREVSKLIPSPSTKNIGPIRQVIHNQLKKEYSHIDKIVELICLDKKNTISV